MHCRTSRCNWRSSSSFTRLPSSPAPLALLARASGTCRFLRLLHRSRRASRGEWTLATQPTTVMRFTLAREKKEKKEEKSLFSIVPQLASSLAVALAVLFSVTKIALLRSHTRQATCSFVYFLPLSRLARILTTTRIHQNPMIRRTKKLLLRCIYMHAAGWLSGRRTRSGIPKWESRSRRSKRRELYIACTRASCSLQPSERGQRPRRVVDTASHRFYGASWLAFIMRCAAACTACRLQATVFVYF